MCYSNVMVFESIFMCQNCVIHEFKINIYINILIKNSSIRAVNMMGLNKIEFYQSSGLHIILVSEA